MRMKKIEYVDNDKFQQSYTGQDIKTSKIEIGIYDKYCGSASVISIRLSEGRETEKRYIHKVISLSLPRDKVLELREVLNSLEF